MFKWGVIIVVSFLIALVAMGCATVSGPAGKVVAVWEKGADSVTLYDSQGGSCKPYAEMGVMEAMGTQNGQTFHGCWVAQRGLILLQWDDGDIGQLSASAFRKP